MKENQFSFKNDIILLIDSLTLMQLCVRLSENPIILDLTAELYL